MNCKKALLSNCLLILSIILNAQNNDDLPVFNLNNCLEYAKQHYPAFQQVQIDQQILDKKIKSDLSVWYPQIEFSTQFQHSQKGQSGVLSAGGQSYSIELSKKITNPYNFTVNQILFNKDAVLSASRAKPTRTQADLNVQEMWINLQVNVTKAFYDVLLQQRQLEIYESDLLRLDQAYQNALNQYEGGIVDKTDIQRSKIALNNGKALYQNARQFVTVSYSNLRQIMGYNSPDKFIIQTDIDTLLSEMYLDTTLLPDISHRVEYTLLQTERKLLSIDLKYSRWSYIPEISLFGAYVTGFTGDEYSSLYKNGPYANPYYGASLVFPIFNGISRIYQGKIAKLNLKRNEWDMESLKSSVDNEFTNALSIYKSNFENYLFLKENMEEAEKVYDIILLQYKEGIKTYLDLTSAHSDLLTSQLSYYNGIFQVIVSKIDVQKALGLIH